MRILVVEDERKLASALRQALEGRGYCVDLAHDGEEALDYFAANEFDLVLLDVMLPKQDGFHVVRQLRARRCSVPVLLLTAREDTESKVRGLDSGADDYLAKPFDLPELLARIRALLRRGTGERAATLAAADLEVDPAAMTVRRAGRWLSLTTREYQLLELLMRNNNRVLSREAIFDRIWAGHFGGTVKIVDVYINYLRGKVDHGFEPKLLHTVRGVGYALRTDHDEDAA